MNLRNETGKKGHKNSKILPNFLLFKKFYFQNLIFKIDYH